MIEHAPTPWTYRDVSGAGLEICAPVYQVAGVDLPRGMPEAPIHVFQFTAPQVVQIAAERWVQFEPKGWSEMQEANAAFIVRACNSHDALVKALKPFAELADICDHFNHPDDKRVCKATIDGVPHVAATAGDCRKARAALTAAGAPHES